MSKMCVLYNTTQTAKQKAASLPLEISISYCLVLALKICMVKTTKLNQSTQNLLSLLCFIQHREVTSGCSLQEFSHKISYWYLSFAWQRE